MSYKIGDKFIVEIDQIYKEEMHEAGSDRPLTLYKMKNFNSLVFDEVGLSKLEGGHQDRGLEYAQDVVNRVVNLTPGQRQELFGDPDSTIVFQEHSLATIAGILDSSKPRISVGDVLRDITADAYVIVTDVRCCFDKKSVLVDGLYQNGSTCNAVFTGPCSPLFEKIDKRYTSIDEFMRSDL